MMGDVTPAPDAAQQEAAYQLDLRKRMRLAEEAIAAMPARLDQGKWAPSESRAEASVGFSAILLAQTLVAEERLGPA